MSEHRMIESLYIENFILIDELKLDLQQGFSVITGETGAGKSILLDAIAFLQGQKAQTSLIRPGQDLTSVSAEIYIKPDHHLMQMLIEEDYISSEETLILRRTYNRQSRSKAYLNDKPISLQFLKTIASQLIDIQGQFSQVTLIQPKNYLSLVDQYGGFQSALEQMKATYNSWQDALKYITELEKELLSYRQQEDYIREQFDKINSLNPQSGEEDELKAEKKKLQERFEAQKTLKDILEGLTHSQGVSLYMNKLQSLFALLPEKDEQFEELNNAFSRMLIEFDEVTINAQRMPSIDDGADQLAEIEDRLHQLKSIARRFHIEVEQLPELAQELKTKLEFLEEAEYKLSEACKKEQTERDIFIGLAEKLHAERGKAADEFAQNIHKELKQLGLPKVKCDIQLNKLPLEKAHARGVSEVQFLVSTNPGMPLAPLEKIASGGELSRFVLTLKTLLNTKLNIPIMIFDEIDTGVSGAVSDAMGQKMLAIAKGNQVICISHAPQIAAQAQQHLHISKKATGKQTKVNVRYLEALERREVIAQMLSAKDVTDPARETAEKLLGQELQNAQQAS